MLRNSYIFDRIIEYKFLNVLYCKLSICCFFVPRRNSSFWLV